MAIVAGVLSSSCLFSDDPLLGSWRVTRATCDGVPQQLQSSLTLTYAANGTFTGEFSGSTCASMRFSGTFSRTGLTVTENPTLQDCGSGCTITIAGPGSITCTGQSATSTSQTYRVNMGVTDVMEQFVPANLTFCRPGANPLLLVAEVERFERI